MQFIRTPLGIAVDTGAPDPLPIRHILAIGRNYAEHAAETGSAVPERPMIFTKNPASACLHLDTIRIPRICRDESTGGPRQVDYEAELAVILGSPVLDAAPDTALHHVLGYCCANDVSARWWQRHGSGGQFCRGKGFDTFCPLGPRVVPARDIPHPQDLRIACRLNGAVMQQDSTRAMIHTVASLIAQLSAGTTLLPGTVILTGTPSGVGMARTPPVYLAPGDTVEVEIERIGVLRNTVADA